MIDIFKSIRMGGHFVGMGDSFRFNWYFASPMPHGDVDTIEIKLEWGRYDRATSSQILKALNSTFENLKENEKFKIAKKDLEDQKILILKSNNKWEVNLEKIRNLLDLEKHYIEDVKDLSWIKGNIMVEPDVEFITDKQNRESALIRFFIHKEDVIMNSPQKIFLSHKSADKPLVRQFKDTLKTLGFDVWLDEDDMQAGDNLHREILQGFKDSCSAIFFITHSFKDESFLAKEIDYAINEKMNKKEKFSIITLVLTDENVTEKPTVPDLLKTYIWKEPKSHLEALRNIINALPIKTENIIWKG